MLSSRASAPADSISFAYLIQPPVETPLRLPMTGICRALRAACDVPEVAAGVDLIGLLVGEVAHRFGKAVGALVEEAVEPEGLEHDLLFEQGVQHDRAGARGFELAKVVEVPAQRRGRGDDGAAKFESEIGGRKVGQCTVLLSGWISRFCSIVKLLDLWGRDAAGGLFGAGAGQKPGGKAPVTL